MEEPNVPYIGRDLTMVEKDRSEETEEEESEEEIEDVRALLISLRIPAPKPTLPSSARK